MLSVTTLVVVDDSLLKISGYGSRIEELVDLKELWAAFTANVLKRMSPFDRTAWALGSANSIAAWTCRRLAAMIVEIRDRSAEPRLGSLGSWGVHCGY